MGIEAAIPWRAIRTGGLLLATIAQTACLGGLTGTLKQTNVELRNAVDSFDRAIDSLSRQSSDWQVTLQQLEKSIVADVQSTVRVEVTNLLREGVLGAGVEFRCDGEFISIRTARELARIRNDLARTLNGAGLKPPIPLLPIPPTQPYVCSAVPVAVDMSLGPERRSMLHVFGFDLRSLPISADVIDAAGVQTPVSGSLGVISDTELVLDLTERGAGLTENHRLIAFSWNGSVQSVIRVLAPGAEGPSCHTETVLVTPGSNTFVPPRVGKGDADFSGHGPCVLFNLRLDLDLLRSRLTANFDMDAYECSDYDKRKKDFTEARGSGQIVLFQVTSPGDRILGFDLGSSSSNQYIDSDHQDDLFTLGGTNPVEKLIFVGDTDGNEAGTRTQVTIFFRELRIQVEKCG